MSEDYKTEQEKFWAGEFGDSYQERNAGINWIASNTAFFSRVLQSVGSTQSVCELGPNIGLNLIALRTLLPAAKLHGVEISETAICKLKENVPDITATHASVLEWEPEGKVDLVFTKGVLIHINPEYLSSVYDKIFRATKKYILIAEYYNPVPQTIPYRGHDARLFKRDFAGEILDAFPDLIIRDYGFAWRRDPLFPQDDLTWVLLEKADA